MNLNSNILRLSGSAEISAPLEIGKRYAVGMEVGIKKAEQDDNENGTFDMVYKAVLIRAEIKNETGTIKTKDKNSQSQKLQAQIKLKAREEGKDEQVEYAHYMILLRHFWPQVKDYLEQLRKDEEGV